MHAWACNMKVSCALRVSSLVAPGTSRYKKPGPPAFLPTHLLHPPMSVYTQPLTLPSDGTRESARQPKHEAPQDPFACWIPYSGPPPVTFPSVSLQGHVGSHTNPGHQVSVPHDTQRHSFGEAAFLPAVPYVGTTRTHFGLFPN